MSETIVFFGSGPVAAESLKLISRSFEVEAVVTKPKPIHHRGEFPVLETAQKLKLKTITATNKKELSEVFNAKPVKSRLGVLIDFGILISQDVIDYFPLGIVNSHFSVLPEWRGADPITFAILSGQKKTGVSLMLLVEAMDEGPLIAYKECGLPTHITTPQLTKILIGLSDSLLKKSLPTYANHPTALPQSTTGRKVSYSRKLEKSDGVIDWSKAAEQIEREIRAFIEWPKSRSNLLGKDIIITKAHAHSESILHKKPGEVEIAGKTLMVNCQSGVLCIEKLKPAGKKEMTSGAFLAGQKGLL